MNSMTTRIARITAASALTLGLGALAAGPALADGHTWAGSVPPTVTSDGGATTDGIVRGGGNRAAEDGMIIIVMSDGGATTDGRESVATIGGSAAMESAEDGSGTEIVRSGGIDTQKVRAAEDAGTESYQSWAG